MPLGDFVEAGTMPKPLILGRLGRLLFGLGAGFYFIWNIIQQGERVSADIPVIGYWIGVGFAWWYFSDLVVVGFSRKWGRWPQVAVAPVVQMRVTVDRPSRVSDLYVVSLGREEFRRPTAHFSRATNDEHAAAFALAMRDHFVLLLRSERRADQQ